MALIVAPDEIINHRFHRGPSGKRDRLDDDAANAAACGMSYGGYKAAEREGRLPTQALAAKDQDDQEPAPITAQGDKRKYTPKNYPPQPCEVCGGMFTPHAKNSKYCCEDCRTEANKANNRKAGRRFRAQAKEAQA